MRGRKPKPDYLRVLDGNAGRRPENTDAPQPTGDLHLCPDSLTDSQKEGWRYAIAHAPPGMLKLIDRSVFKAWVVAEDMFELARQKVSEIGMMVKGDGGKPIQNPYLKIQNQQAMLLMKAAAELGFSPTARPRVKVSKSSNPSNPFADLKSLTD